MKLKIFFCFLIISLILFSACARSEGYVIYKIDDGAVSSAGFTKDDIPILMHVLFSFECTFKEGTSLWLQKNESEIIRHRLSTKVANYMNELFPQHTLRELREIMADENSTFFLDGFLEHIEGSDELKSREAVLNTEVTSLRLRDFPSILPEN